MTQHTELAIYTTAGQMAQVFECNTTRMRELLLELGECMQALRQTFFDSYHYKIDVQYHSSRIDCNERGAAELIEHMKRSAWAAIIDKLELRKIMSSDRQRQMDDQLGIGSRSSGARQAVPDITEATIISVIQGFAQSADEFLAEAIEQEYDFWKTRRLNGYKTNDSFSIGHKIIHPYIVEEGHRGDWSVRYNSRSHVQALDGLFHRLDGAGVPPGHNGPLVDAIQTLPSGTNLGETEYFRFRCFKNGNLHLEFKRQDLLDKFNQIAGRKLLGKKQPA